MRTFFLLAATALLGFSLMDTTFLVDRVHSDVGFKVRHLGIANVKGEFTDYEAKVTVDPDDLTTLRAEAVIRTASLDTGVERRDNHLRSDDFFDAANHPTITFVSTGVRNLDGDQFELIGDLTIRGITKEVVLEVEYLGQASMGGTDKVGFEAEGSINRFDFGLHWDALTEAGGLMVGEEVRLILELEANAD